MLSGQRLENIILPGTYPINDVLSRDVIKPGAWYVSWVIPVPLHNDTGPFAIKVISPWPAWAIISSITSFVRKIGFEWKTFYVASEYLSRNIRFVHNFRFLSGQLLRFHSSLMKRSKAATSWFIRALWDMSTKRTISSISTWEALVFRSTTWKTWTYTMRLV